MIKQRIKDSDGGRPQFFLCTTDEPREGGGCSDCAEGQYCYPLDSRGVTVLRRRIEDRLRKDEKFLTGVAIAFLS